MFERLREDIQSVFHRDPAARNAFEVLTCYPGMHAIWIHRLSGALWGMGSDLASSRNSAWGLVNAVTEYVDHHRRARSQDYRLDSAWFGQGSQLKSRALNQALTLLQ